MSEPVVPSTETETGEQITPAPVLRREAILPRERRGGLGAVALLCSLAGVASGFALATTILATQLAQSEGRARRITVDAPIRHVPYLGVSFEPNRAGPALITGVATGSPAQNIGLAVGDQVMTFDDETLDQPGELYVAVRRSKIGHEATIEVRRGDQLLILHPTLTGNFTRE